MAKAKHQYEAMFLIGPAATAENESGVAICKQIIERHDGEIMHIKKWDERKLAYEMGKHKRGTYVIAFFKAPGSAVGAIERDVNFSEEVLRVLVLKADHLNQKEMEAVQPQPIQPREERNPWDRPGFNNDGPRRDDRPRAPRRDESDAVGAGKE